MVYAAESHLRYVEQAFNATSYINKGAKVCEPLYLAVHNLSCFKGLIEFLLAGLELFVQDDFPRENHIVPIPIHLQDFQLPDLADELFEIVHKTAVNVGSRHKAADSNVHKQTAFDPLNYRSLYGFAFLVGLLENNPGASCISFTFG